MRITVRTVASRDLDRVSGTFLREYETYTRAFSAIGELVDKNTARGSVCIVANDEDSGDAWTIFPKLA